MAAKKKGYTLIILLFALSVLSIGLMIAVPVWQTQIQREKEEELIFRGKQYVEAVRLFQLKYPGTFPRTLEELIEEKYLRRLYKDPMTEHGKWNIILLYQGVSTKEGGAPQRVLSIPQNALQATANPRIMGVQSSSAENSIKIYEDQSSYDKWLFFYGKAPNTMPEIIYYGQEERD